VKIISRKKLKLFLYKTKTYTNQRLRKSRIFYGGAKDRIKLLADEEGA
jgi:hypothetical protein